MLSISNLKKFAAILLMICFALPLSRCDRNARIDLSRDPASESPRPLEKPAAIPEYEDKFAYQNIAGGDPAGSALTIAAFFWPLLFFAFGFIGFGYRASMATNVIEIFLCAGSAYMIYGITLFGELRYGGYLAFLALAAYSMASLAQTVSRFRARNRRTG